MAENIETFLNSQNIKFEIKNYSPLAKNAREAAEEMGMPEERLLKSLLLKSKSGYILLLIPSSAKIDFNELSQRLNEKYELAPPEDVADLTGYQIGTVSPFCLKTNIPIYLDKAALAMDFVGVGSGEKGKEIILRPNDLLKIVSNIVK